MGAALSGSQVAQVVYQAGFRGDDLINMVGIARRESGWQPSAHRTDQNPSALSGDLGLFQINYVNWPTVSQALGLSDKSQLFDPLTSARAAKVLFDKGGYSPWTAGPGGWTQGGNPLHGVNVGTARQAVAEAEQAGLLGQDFGAQGRSSSYPDVQTSGNAFEGGPVVLPSDARTVSMDGKRYAIFDVGGIWIRYEISGDVSGGGGEWTPGPEMLQQMAGNIVDAGAVEELGTLGATFGTFRGFWDSILGTVMGYSNPARNDAGVLRVLAEFAARPDMSDAELQNRLQATDWYQNHTTLQLEWNSLSGAEKRRRTDETSARMGEIYFQFVGQRANPNDPTIQNYLERVASGQMGFGAYTEIVKTLALENPESPWSRQERDEQEQQRQRPIDLENTQQRIRETTERWGLQWSNETIGRWAREIVENRSSDEDLVLELRRQAQVLFPWKDPEVETATAAAPWLETYRRTMEKSATVLTSEVQRALVDGQTPWEFEQQLRGTDAWLGTKNGQEAIIGIGAEMGRRMGFNN